MSLGVVAATEEILGSAAQLKLGQHKKMETADTRIYISYLRLSMTVKIITDIKNVTAPLFMSGKIITDIKNVNAPLTMSVKL